MSKAEANNREGVGRRSFLEALTGPLIVPSCVLAGRGTAPSDRVAIGIIGSGHRGMFESRFYVQSQDCEVVAICDVQESRRTEAKATFEKLYSGQPRGVNRRGIRLYNDFRELLRQKDVDAVYIATPDHWHVPITIAAQQAGKHCHTEKPLATSIEMDLAALGAVRKYGRSFLLGAERRSAPAARHALELVLNGRIGKLREIYVVVTPSKSGGSATPVLPVPRGWDYGLWLGPAPETPFCADRVGEGIFQIRDYSLGMIANWGAHPLDQVQFFADQVGLGIPLTYEGAGSIAEGGLFNCVNHWKLRCTYRGGLVMHFMDSDTFTAAEGVPKAPLGRSGDLALFVGTEGWVASSYEKVTTHPESLFGSVIAPNEAHLPSSMTPVELVPPNLNPWAAPAAAHQLGWVAYLKSEADRKTPKPTVDPIESAVRTDLVSQLSEICVRSRRSIRWDPEKQTIAGDREAAKLMSVPMREPWASLVKKFSAPEGLAG